MNPTIVDAIYIWQQLTSPCILNETLLGTKMETKCMFSEWDQ